MLGLVACEAGAPRSDGAVAGDAPPRDAPLDPLYYCAGLDQPQAIPGDPVSGHTYAGFALPAFFAVYCTRCHSSALVGEIARGGAPATVDLDDEASVRASLTTIRAAVALAAYMPVGAPRPTCEERAALLAWIDAGAP